MGDEEEEKRLIDDGLSCVAALVECKLAYDVNPQETPTGLAWSDQLERVFGQGLLVRVVRYMDNNNRELRIVWNIAKHDE